MVVLAKRQAPPFHNVPERARGGGGGGGGVVPIHGDAMLSCTSMECSHLAQTAGCGLRLLGRRAAREFIKRVPVTRPCEGPARLVAAAVTICA